MGYREEEGSREEEESKEEVRRKGSGGQAGTLKEEKRRRKGEGREPEERRTGPEIVRSTEGGREVGHLNEGLWEVWMEKEVTEVKTRKEDTNKGQRGRSILRRESD